MKIIVFLSFTWLSLFYFCPTVYIEVYTLMWWKCTCCDTGKVNVGFRIALNFENKNMYYEKQH